MTTASSTRRPRAARRIGALSLGAAILIAPLTGLAAAPAYAAGDVCDICAITFDLAACESLGGYPYDSTLEEAPPAIRAAANPAPAAPAPAPAAPAPAAPVAPAAPAAGTSGTTASSGGTATTDTAVSGAVAATVPLAPAALAHTVKDRTVTFTWTAPADGGSAITGYKLVLNGGTPIALPATETRYEVTLGAGEYDAVLIASNAIGDSVASTELTGIVVAAATATPTAKATPIAEAAQEPAPTASLAGPLTLGGLVVAAGGLLTWWWLRRRSAATAE